MRKIAFAFVMLAFCVSSVLLINHYNYDLAKQVGSLYKPPEQSKEELNQDIYISLLMPYIEKEINNYYSKTLKAPPSVSPITIYVLNAERLDEYRSFLFRIKLKVFPYIGPHNSVGIDCITFILNGGGEIKVEKFEHIKSFALPPNYLFLLKE